MSNRSDQQEKDLRKNNLRHARVLDCAPTEKSARARCDSCDKALFSSKHDARRSMSGPFGSKSMRVYECPSMHGKFHVTKERSTRLR